MIAGILIAFLFSAIIYWFYLKIRQKNSELKETNAAKDKLFAVIAHDLRGPTGNLAAFMEHLNETYNEHSPEELRKILLSLFKAAENVSLLLENLLIWAQSQLNTIEFRPTGLNLTDLIQTSIKGLVQTADNKQINIRLELNDRIFVLADSGMVQIIVRNILSNAIKFTHRGGSVIIRSAATDPKSALISITDNGIGIEKHLLSRIFDLSGSFHTKGTENEKSTGLGLILVKEFVEKNNGTLTIQSQVNEGTVVSFTLPVTGAPGLSG
jgi:signal transduction histidine kinase